MKRIIIVAAALALIGYTALGIHIAVSKQEKIQLNQVQLRSTTSELKALQLKYDQLNSNLDIELQKNTTDDKRVQQLESEKQELQKQKEELESKLQSKLRAKQEADSIASRALNTLTGTAVASADTSTGDKYSLMAAAGISVADYAAVDYIVSHEGSWAGTTVYNRQGSGAYGLCQALPASKMASAGPDYMTNPVTQLRWCAEYASQRYGGWWGAHSFWISNNWW